MALLMFGKRELESYTRKKLLKGEIGVSAGQELPLCKDELCGAVTACATATCATSPLLCSSSDSNGTASATIPSAWIC